MRCFKLARTVSNALASLTHAGGLSCADEDSTTIVDASDFTFTGKWQNTVVHDHSYLQAERATLRQQSSTPMATKMRCFWVCGAVEAFSEHPGQFAEVSLVLLCVILNVVERTLLRSATRAYLLVLLRRPGCWTGWAAPWWPAPTKLPRDMHTTAYCMSSVCFLLTNLLLEVLTLVYCKQW